MNIWNSWKYGRKNFERHSGWGWVLQGCFHLLEEYDLDILRSKALLPDFHLGSRVMFYFGLDLLSQSKLAWLGQLHVLLHSQGATVAMAHQMLDYRGWFAEHKFVWCDYSQHKMLVFTSFALKPGHTKPTLTTLSSLVNYRWFKTSENGGHWDESWDKTGLYLQFKSHQKPNLGFFFPSPKFLSFTEILRAFPRNIESKRSPHFRGIPQRI